MQPLLRNFPSALELPEAAAAAGSVLPGRLGGPSMEPVAGTALFDQENPGARSSFLAGTSSLWLEVVPRVGPYCHFNVGDTRFPLQPSSTFMLVLKEVQAFVISVGNRTRGHVSAQVG